jgi:hypothetical protein
VIREYRIVAGAGRHPCPFFVAAEFPADSTTITKHS